jgi:hypothetical protein
MRGGEWAAAATRGTAAPCNPATGCRQTLKIITGLGLHLKRAYLGAEETEALRPVLDVARAVEENHVLLQPPAAGGSEKHGHADGFVLIGGRGGREGGGGGGDRVHEVTLRLCSSAAKL